jgi:hypothetical protein
MLNSSFAFSGVTPLTAMSVSSAAWDATSAEDVAAADDGDGGETAAAD